MLVLAVFEAEDALVPAGCRGVEVVDASNREEASRVADIVVVVYMCVCMCVCVLDYALFPGNVENVCVVVSCSMRSSTSSLAVMLQRLRQYEHPSSDVVLVVCMCVYVYACIV